MPLRRIRKDEKIKSYFAGKDTCGACPIKKTCTDARHMDEEARQTVRDLRDTATFKVSRRRKKIEMLFAHLKRHLGFKRLRLRGLKGANEELLLAATAQNLKPLAKMFPCYGSAQPTSPTIKNTAFDRDYSCLGRSGLTKHKM